jgi:thioesterase domain-containing protein/aryl carrier-like protein
LREWLRGVQQRQLEIRPYEHTPRLIVHQCSDVPLTVPLFESVLVFQEYEVRHADAPVSSDGSHSNHTFGVRTGAPLTLIINPGERLSFRLVFDVHKVGAWRAAQPLHQLEAVLKAFTSHADLHVGEVDIANDNKRIQTGPSAMTNPSSHMEGEAWQALVLDGTWHVAPPGVIGRLCIDGRFVTHGSGMPADETAVRFIPHPHSQSPGARVYLTDDVARGTDLGLIELVWHTEPVAITRGVIDTERVERVLLSHADIGEVTVVVRKESEGPHRIAAYVVPRPGRHVALNGVRQFARRQLPIAMAPTEYVVLRSLPRTADGTVDGSALPSPTVEHSTSRVLLAGGPSHDILEFQLARIWEEVFDIRPVTPDDNFFDLGGDSLIGMALLTRIKAVLSYDLPLSTLFEGATIRAMATVLRRQAGSTAWASVVPLRKSGDRPPFFCVHPIGGNVLAFVDLVQYINVEYPLYALQSIGLDGRVEPYSTVEEMARHYLGEIRAIQPRGPYYVGGFSFGGLVAYELARQLEQEGSSVGMVALVDMECPIFEGRSIFKERMPKDDASLLAEAGLNMGTFYRDQPEKRRELEGLASHALIDQVLDHLRVGSAWRENARRVFTILLHSSRALRDYVPCPYNGRVTVFRATEGRGSAEYAHLLPVSHDKPEAMLAWNHFAAGGVELVDVPGDHITMLAEPHVRVLGGALTDCLERACGRVTSPMSLAS